MNDKTIKILNEALSFYAMGEENQTHQKLQELIKRDDLIFYIKYYKYRSGVAAPMASIINSFQQTIYNLVALELLENDNYDKLIKTLEPLLEVPCYIEENCTNAKFDIAKILEQLLKFPKKERKNIINTICITIILFAFLKYSDININIDIDIDLDLGIDIKQEQKIDDNSLLERIFKKNKSICAIVEHHYAVLFNSLPKLGDKVQINTTVLSKIKRKPKRKPKYFSGNYYLRGISQCGEYVLLEGVKSLGGFPMKVKIVNEDFKKVLLTVHKISCENIYMYKQNHDETILRVCIRNKGGEYLLDSLEKI